jgi:hypothetical protein
MTFMRDIESNAALESQPPVRELKIATYNVHGAVGYRRWSGSAACSPRSTTTSSSAGSAASPPGGSSAPKCAMMVRKGQLYATFVPAL